MSQENYIPTSEDEAKARNMMDADSAAKSEVRSDVYESLSDEDKQLLSEMQLKFDRDGFVGNVKGHKLNARLYNGVYFAEIDGTEVSEEDARKVYEKYSKFKYLQNFFNTDRTEYNQMVKEKKAGQALGDIL